MHITKQTIDQVDLRGKRVIIRVDFNVPLDDALQITEDSRIRAALPTINHTVDEGGSVILCSHLGRPKGKPCPELSLAPVAKRLKRFLGKDVIFSPACFFLSKPETVTFFMTCLRLILVDIVWRTIRILRLIGRA